MGKPKRLTADEWEACFYPGTMLPHLRTGSARKLRLFLCACCRRIWPLLFDERSRRIVEATESWADEAMKASELKPIQLAACLAVTPNQYDRAQLNRVNIPAQYRGDGRYYYAARAARSVGALHKAFVVNAAWAASQAGGDPAGVSAEQLAQTNLIRDIFGNPFRPVTFAPSWRTDTVLSLARGMYESRDFAAMPILADALQDAGCDSDDVLAHCRDPHGVHVRGCWVVDGVLGKV